MSAVKSSFFAALPAKRIAGGGCSPASFLQLHGLHSHSSGRLQSAPVCSGHQQQQAQETKKVSAESSDPDEIPAGCMRYSVTLSKPLGLVLEEDRAAGTIIVADVLDGGNAAKVGGISTGDILIATTGYTRTTEQVYNDIVVRGGEQVVRLAARGERFETIMAAIGSHPAHIQVTLEFQRC